MNESLHVTEYNPGNGAGTLVLLHGFPVDHRMWDACAPFVSAEWRVLGVDLPGLGESPIPEGEPSLDQSAGLVAEVIVGLKGPDSGPLICAGLSMGGYVAQAIMRVNPDLLDGVVLLDTRVTADAAGPRENRFKVAAEVERLGSSEPVMGMATATLSEETVEERPDIVEFMQTLIRSQSAAGVAWSQRAMASREDSTEVVKAFAKPTLIIVGEDDTISPPDVMMQIARLVPGARAEVIAHAGHMSPVEQPAAVAEVINTFLVDSFGTEN